MHQAKQTPPTAAAGDVSRRDFLKGGVIAGVAGGVGLGAAYFGYGRSVPNPLRVGVIGTGDEGGVLIGAINPAYVQVVAIADIRPCNVHRAFHGDLSSENATKVRPGLMKKYGWGTEAEAKRNVTVYDKNYEDILNDKDVEAVIIALPLHLHAPAAIKAMQKGKHVLCEKLMAHSVHEAKEMALIAEQTGKTLAIGHQRHYSILYDNAAETIRRGVIGDIHHIRAQWFRGNQPGNDSWQQPLPVKAMEDELDKFAKESGDLLSQLAKLQKKIEAYRQDKAGGQSQKLAKLLDEDPPRWDAVASASRDKAEFEYRQRLIKLLDSKIKPKEYGYQDFVLNDKDGTVRKVPAIEELIRWRLWARTGGGLMAELGSHQLDAASIFVSALREDHEKVHPLTVTAVGGRSLFGLDRQCEDHVYCTYEFPGPEYKSDKNKKIVVTYSSINGNGYGGYGEVVMGTKGTLIVQREEEVLLIPSGGPAGSGASHTTVQAAKGGGPTLDTTESGGPRAAKKQGGGGPVSRGYTEEIEHWAWCIRNPSPDHKPRCHPKVALADAVIALVSNEAIRTGKPIKFQEAWFDIKSPATPENIAPNTARYKS